MTWRLVKHTGAADEPLSGSDDWTIYDEDSRSICCEGYRLPDDVARRYVAMILAAPKMLAALREIADDYADRFDMDSPSTNPGMKYVVKQARAAIAAAEGKP